MIQLKPEHIKTIKEITQSYLSDYDTQEWQEQLKAHNEHREDFRPMFSKDSLEKMMENEFKNLLKETWAMQIWGNKDWHLDNDIIKPSGGYDVVKNAFTELLYGSDNIEKRLDTFRDNVKGLGFSTISEILNFVYPDQYCLFNAKTKFGLQYMNIDILPKRYLKYGINTGREYLESLQLLTAIKNVVEENGLKKMNFIDLDAFFWYIFDKEPLKTSPSRKISTLESEHFDLHENSEIEIPASHEDLEKSKQIQAEIAKIGEIWGYKIWIPIPDRDRVKKLWSPQEGTLLDNLPGSYGANALKVIKFIDVLWINKESIVRAFEVESTTSIYSGLLRMSDLLKLYPDLKVKIHIVAPSERKDKVFSELMRPTFEDLRGVCLYTSFDKIVELGKEKKLNLFDKNKTLDAFSESIIDYTG
jgi:hypothetical protein